MKDTSIVSEYYFEFAIVNYEDGSLLPFDNEVVSFDELVFNESGDDVGFADSLCSLHSFKLTTNK